MATVDTSKVVPVLVVNGKIVGSIEDINIVSNAEGVLTRYEMEVQER